MSTAGSGAQGEHHAGGARRRPTPRRIWHALAAFLLVLFAALIEPTGLHAHAPADEVTAGGRLTLPRAPSDFNEARDGEVRWDYPRALESDASALRERLPELWAGLEADLGVDVEDALVIRVARNPDEMRRLAPEGMPPPSYATGVAYPHAGLILLSMTAPESWGVPDAEEVFHHELSHVALRRAVRGREMPRWFVEGVAIHQSGEQSLERFETLWDGHGAGDLIPLAELDGRFPARAHEVDMAYAQAADVVTFLRRDDRGARRFRELIEEMREGAGFDAALLDAYALTPTQLEREWLAELDDRMSSWPVLVGGGTFWVLAAVLLVWAWRRRRSQAKKKLAAMEAEERERDQTFERLERIIDARVEREEQPLLLVSADPPQGREPGVPTVEHDGRQHTLH